MVLAASDGDFLELPALEHAKPGTKIS
jgi:hypothetical protein